MKILFDFRKYDGVIGGVEQGVIQISKRMSDNDHGIVILCKKSRLEEVQTIFNENPKMKIIPLDIPNHSMSLGNTKLDSFTIQNIAESERADIIHFFYNWSFPFKKKVPCVLTVHDVIPFTFREAMGFYRNLFMYKPGIRLACRLNNMIATVSEFSRQDIHKKVGVPLDKIRFIPNGLREVNPKNAGLEKELKNKYNLDKFILNVGGIHDRKNIVRLVTAFSDLVKSHDYPGKLLITGSISGHHYKDRMKRMCDEAIANTGMTDRVVFSGFVTEEELDSLFRIGDLLIYPSLYEGFGIPILEAMKLGLPVITSNVTGMPEVASDIADLIDPTDVSAITGAMADLLQDKDRKKEMIKRGIERAKTFTWEKVVESYLKLYADTIALYK